MKFSEMPYERVDLEQLLSDIRNITEGFQTAGSAEEQISWIHKMDEMMGKVQTMERLAYIRYTINTQDPFYAAEQEHNSQTSPLIEEAMQPYYRAIVESPYRAELEQKIGKMLFVRHEFALKGFSPEITKLVQEENLLTAEYQALMGSAQIPFDGKVLNIAQMGQYTVSPDREVRKQAFEAMGRYYDSKQKELDEIFDKLVKNRTEQAKRLGYDSYVDLAYIRRERCYTVEDVRNFRKQVLEDLVPVNCRLKEAQAKRIGVDHICFYDDAYSFPDGNATPQGTPEELLAAAKEMYTEMSPETAEFIQAMFDMDLFDVLAKPGKTTGGYCDSLPVYKCPFIFANFNGTSGDVEVLTHEAGHAFASYVSSREVPYLDLHWPT
ncbi:MAG TPA: M3 family oligoendopeptidase, partial [Lachnospiraceae bacterium]|nr:M3 family oligoendopeptidase [Lachnospiraceae bacterium]